MKSDHVLAMLVACFATLVSTLFLVDTQTVFDPPYLLPLLNTLFLAIIPCSVAYTAAKLFLSFGSVPVLILGKGMLALGLGGAISGWFIGSPDGPNTTISIYNCGALLCASLSAYSALALARHQQWPHFNRPRTILALCWLGLAVTFGGVILAAVTGILPPFIIQGIGPTLIGKTVLVGAISLFMVAAGLIFLNRKVSGIELFRCYAAGLMLMAIGLTGVLLQHYVGSPLGWAGRCSQYAGALCILTGIAGLWKKKFSTGKSLAETAEELAQERIVELEKLASSKEVLIRQKEERLKLALDAANLAAWDWDISSGDISWNSEHYRMLGYEPDSFTPQYHHWADRVHPDDLPATEELISKAIASGVDYRAQFRAILPSGVHRTLEALGRIERDAAGVAVKLHGAMSDITDRVQMMNALKQQNELLEQRVAERTHKLQENEAALKHNEERLNTILTALIEAVIVLDPDGKVLYMNDAVTRITGCSEEEIYEYGCRINIVRTDGTPLSVSEQPALIATRTGKPVQDVIMGVQKEIGTIWISVNSRPLFDNQGNLTGTVSSFYDISERIKMEAELRLRKEQYKAQAELLNLTHDAVMVRTLGDDRIIFWNNGAVQQYGWSEKEALGKVTHELFSTEFSTPLEEIKAQLLANGCWNGELTHTRRNGTHITVSSRWALQRDQEGNPSAVLEINNDISERYLAEKERLALERQLLHAQKLESLGVLAGGIAHDFNNILMAILGNAELARMKLAPESPLVTNLQQIEQAAMRAADLAKQMLAYSGKGKFIISKLNLNQLIEEMTSILEVSISRKVILKLSLAPDLPTVEADSSQIQQIIMNLVINASEAIGTESGFITIRTGIIDCSASYLTQFALTENIATGLYVYLEITDTGCGMDSETLNRIFDPFFTTKFTGRGLGMAAVHGIVRGHKGVINVYSEPGKGTTFKVLLPASDIVAGIEETNIINRDCIECGTVLLVDDEEGVRNIGSDMLKELGVTVLTAKDGEEAVEIFKSGVDIACVILDLTMPQMDGEQCFRKLRKIDPEVKIIMSSGYSELEIAKRFANMGVTGFIQKPYNFKQLGAVLKSVL